MNISTPKVAWITGGGSGIGRALALKLSNNGWCVVISGRTSSKLDETCDLQPAHSIHAYPCDVTHLETVRNAAESIRQHFGEIDLAIFNAGTFEPRKATDFSAEWLRTTHEVNLFGVVNGVDAVLTSMKERGKGHIVMLSSVAGYRGLPLAAAYSSSKAAVIALAESMKFDLDNMGISITVVCPGFVKTPLTDKNEFNMPFMVSADYAAEVIYKGLMKGDFEISFPRRMAWSLKLAQRLPYSLYFPLMKRLMQ